MQRVHELRALSDMPAAAIERPPYERTEALRVSFFGHDIGDSAIRKRISALRAEGAQVTSYTFQRNPKPGQSSADENWENVALGETVDGRYLRRLWRLAAALGRIFAHRSQLREADIIYARNIDMLLLAMIGRWAAGARAKVVYEVLDVRPIFTGAGMISRLFRWAERRLLARSDMLVVSSPDFVEHYFEPVQRYAGPWHLLENKLLPSAMAPVADTNVQSARNTPPWRIGWFGILRCRRSFEVLCRLAATFPDTVQIVIRGAPTDAYVSQTDIDDAVARHSNIEFHGRYRHPDDLAAMYADVHFAWAIDYLEAGANSEWLLANRIYEGGLFGAVAIARSETATGRFIERNRLGFSLPEPVEQSAAALLRVMTPTAWTAAHADVVASPRQLFIDFEDTKALLDRLSTCESRAAEWAANDA